MSIKRISLDEVLEQKPLSKKRVKEISSFKDSNISDCPELTTEELKQLTPYREKNPEWYKVVVAKTPIQIRIDNDVLAELKKEGRGYQTRINKILRDYVFGKV